MTFTYKFCGFVSSKVVSLIVALRRRKFETYSNICVSSKGVSLNLTKVKPKLNFYKLARISLNIHVN